MAKHFTVQIEDNQLSYARRPESIQREAALDGIYVIRTSEPAERLSAEDTVRGYKNLALVERLFRTLKSIDILVRPIHHHQEKRVRAHVFLCMLAYDVEWHMRQALAPLLFDDDDKAAGEARRASVVAPAQRSPRAQRKTRTQRTDEGLPIQSFQTLLDDLATVTQNRIRFCDR